MLVGLHPRAKRPESVRTTVFLSLANQRPMNSSKEKLLAMYDRFPFHEHPLWVAVRRKDLSLEQILDAETQHWIRTRAGQQLRKEAVKVAKGMSPQIFEAVFKTYLEECTADETGPSHLDLIERLLLLGGRSREMIESTQSRPANAAAIALYKDISSRGAGCHMLGAGTVEHYYSQLCPHIFEAYTVGYGMSPEQAETYRIHSDLDATHAERAFSIIDEAIRLHGWSAVEESVRDAFVATSLHYDGMLHAATGVCSYWNGADQ